MFQFRHWLRPLSIFYFQISFRPHIVSQYLYPLFVSLQLIIVSFYCNQTKTLSWQHEVINTLSPYPMMTQTNVWLHSAHLKMDQRVSRTWNTTATDTEQLKVRYLICNLYPSQISTTYIIIENTFQRIHKMYFVWQPKCQPVKQFPGTSWLVWLYCELCLDYGVHAHTRTYIAMR